MYRSPKKERSPSKTRKEGHRSKVGSSSEKETTPERDNCDDVVENRERSEDKSKQAEEIRHRKLFTVTENYFRGERIEDSFFRLHFFSLFIFPSGTMRIKFNIVEENLEMIFEFIGGRFLVCT